MADEPNKQLEDMLKKLEAEQKKFETLQNQYSGILGKQKEVFQSNSMIVALFEKQLHIQASPEILTKIFEYAKTL